MLKRVSFTSQNEANEVSRFLNGIEISPRSSTEGMIHREIVSARHFISCITQHLFPNDMPLEMVVDLAIQIYNTCMAIVEKCNNPAITSDESGIVMIGNKMGLRHNDFIEICNAPNSFTVLLNQAGRSTRFTTCDPITDPTLGECYHVFVPNTEENENGIQPGSHYMMYLGNQNWLSSNNIYFDVISIPGVVVRPLKEIV